MLTVGMKRWLGSDDRPQLLRAVRDVRRFYKNPHWLVDQRREAAGISIANSMKFFGMRKNKNYESFCLAHKPPTIPPSWYDHQIATGLYMQDSPFHVKNLSGYWNIQQPFAHSAGMLFCLPTVLDMLEYESDVVCITQYRKAILNRRVGRKSKVFPLIQEMGTDDSMHVTPDALSPVGGHQFLVSSWLYFPDGIANQYDLSFYINDMFDFVKAAVECGVIKEGAESSFLDSTCLYPAVFEVGVFPTRWLIDSIRKMETVSKLFLKRSRLRLSSYPREQARALSSLCERLASYMVGIELDERYPDGIPSEVFGWITNVDPCGNGYKSGIAEDGAVAWRR